MTTGDMVTGDMATGVPDPKYTIFVSYDLADAEFVERLCTALRQRGHIVSLAEGEERRIRTSLQQKAMRASQIMLVVVSPSSLEVHGESSVVHLQAGYFKTVLCRHVISLHLRRLSDESNWPINLTSGEIINFTGSEVQVGFERGLDDLEHSLKRYYRNPQPSGLRDPRIHLAPALGTEAPGTPPESFRYEPPPGATVHQPPSAAGVIQVHEKFPLEQYKGWLQAAHQSIRIADIWTSIIGLHAGEMASAVKRGTHLSILLLDPTSKVAVQRGRDMQLEEREVSANVQASIREISEMYLQIKAEADSSLETEVLLKLYDSLPAFPIYAVDGHMLLGFLSFGRRSFGLPWFEVALDSTLGESARQEYERRLEASYQYEIAPPQNLVLTPREYEVLKWLSEGYSQQQIAEILVVEHSTIKKHLQSIYGKLGISDLHQKNKDLMAVKYAQEFGWL